MIAAFFCININMQTFKKFYENVYTGVQHGVKHSHRRSLPKIDGSIVPDYVKAKNDTSVSTTKILNPKIEKLKDSHGMQVCDCKDLEDIRKLYNCIPIKGEIKKLGSTGIQLYYDNNTGNFILRR